MEGGRLIALKKSSSGARWRRREVAALDTNRPRGWEYRPGKPGAAPALKCITRPRARLSFLGALPRQPIKRPWLGIPAAYKQKLPKCYFSEAPFTQATYLVRREYLIFAGPVISTSPLRGLRV